MREAPIRVVLCALVFAGCAAREANWYRIYDARAEFEALRSAPGVETIEAEVRDAKELLDRAERGLSKKRPDDAADLSEIVLLRIEYARAVARRNLSERDAVAAESALDAISNAAEAQRERLQQAQAELAELTP